MERRDRSRRKDTGGGEGAAEASGGHSGGGEGRSGADYHPLASSEGLEHLGQRKGVKSLRNGRDF